MLNLYFDGSAIVILIVVIFSCILKGLYKSRASYLFYVLLVLMLFASIGDFANAYVSQYFEHNEMNRSICYYFNYMYFFAHNNLLPVYVLFIFANMGIWHRFKQERLARRIWLSVVVFVNAITFMNVFTGDVFTVDHNLQYERGPLIVVFYLCAFIFMIMGLVVILKYKRLVRPDKMIVMILLYPITITGIILQAISHNILIEMFTISITALLFNIVIQRPEELVDPITGAKKYNVGYDNIRKILDTGLPVQMMLVKICNYRNIRIYLGQETYERFLRSIAVNLKGHIKGLPFATDLYYLEDGLYAIITEQMDESVVYNLGCKIRDYFSDELTVEEFSVLADTRICMIRCPEDINEYSTLFTFGTTFQMTLPKVREVLKYSDYADDKEFKIKNELDEIITRGLANNRFEMYYQPIYSIVEQRFVCAEALIRLDDEKYGMISPGLFIKAAEISGKIHQIGDFVLEDVCHFISINDFDELGLSYIEINMSASQCIEVDLVDKIKQLLYKYRLDASKINLEITESAADFDPVIIDQNINKLHELGINFALDDYGTGYSNIKRVTSLPIDLVKLDKTFVDGIADPQMWIMVQDTIKMLKEMNKKVLIEGVEEENIVEKFMNLGCDYIQGCEYLQGYYFCKPLPEKEFIQFMKNQRK